MCENGNLELKDEKRQLVSEPDSASDLIFSATNMSKRVCGQNEAE